MSATPVMRGVSSLAVNPTNPNYGTTGPGPNPSWNMNAAGQYDFNGNSGFGNQATNYFPTLAAAENAWSQQYGPTSTSGQVQSLGQPGYLPSPTQYAPAQYSGSQLSLSSMDPALLAALGPQQAMALIQQGFQPQANQSETNLNNTLAQAGLVGGPAVMAQDQLQASLASALAPSLAGAVTNSQGNILSAVGQNAGLNQQTGLANTAAQTTANASNANTINTTNAGNTQIYDQQQQQLLAYIMQQYAQKSGQYANLASGAQSGTNALASGTQNNFQIPTGSSQGISGLFSSLGNIYGNKSTPAATAATGG